MLTREDTQLVLDWLKKNDEHIPESMAEKLWEAVYFAHCHTALSAAKSKALKALAALGQEYDCAAVARAGEGFDLG